MSLRHDPRIKESTRSLVRTVAREMKYRPVASARALVGGRTHMIGVVFASVQFAEKVLLRAYSLALQSISDSLSERNYHLNLAARCDTRDERGGLKLPRMFDEIGVEGFLVIQAPGAELARTLESQNVPYVILDGKSPPGRVSVSVDECRAAEMAVEHLVDLGHRRIASLTTLPADPDANHSPSHRMAEFPRGYLRAMARAGLPAVPGWDEALAGVDKQLEALWGQAELPTALLAYDDSCAGAAITWLGQRGLKVPQDVSVVALHDIGYADIAWLPVPTITCKQNMQAQMAGLAVEKLLHMIANPGEAPESVVLEPKLVVRESTGPCPKAGDGPQLK